MKHYMPSYFYLPLFLILCKTLLSYRYEEMVCVFVIETMQRLEREVQLKNVVINAQRSHKRVFFFYIH